MFLIDVPHSCSLIDVLDHQQSSMNLLMNGGGVSTSNLSCDVCNSATNSLNHQRWKWDSDKFEAKPVETNLGSGEDITYFNYIVDNCK